MLPDHEGFPFSRFLFVCVCVSLRRYGSASDDDSTPGSQEMVNDHDCVRKCFLTDGAIRVIHIEAAHLDLSSFFQRDLEEIVFQVIQPAQWKDIDRDLIIMIQQHKSIFTMFGTKRVYFIKIQMPWQGPSGDIVMMFKDRDDRGRGNVVAPGNRAEGLVIAFEVFQDPLNGED